MVLDTEQINAINFGFEQFKLDFINIPVDLNAFNLIQALAVKLPNFKTIL